MDELSNPKLYLDFITYQFQPIYVEEDHGVDSCLLQAGVIEDVLITTRVLL